MMEDQLDVLHEYGSLAFLLLCKIVHLRSTALFSWLILISFMGMNPENLALVVSTTSVTAGTLGPLDLGERLCTLMSLL